MEEVKKVDETVTDIEKIYSFLSYMLFFGVLIYRMKHESSYVQFHAKQGMILFGLSLANFIFMAIPFVGWFLIPLLNIACLVFFVIGATNALNGKNTELPFIGQFAAVIK